MPALSKVPVKAKRALTGSDYLPEKPAQAARCLKGVPAWPDGRVWSRLPLAHPESAPTFADELNATCFERLLNRGKRSFARLDRFAFDHIQRDD